MRIRCPGRNGNRTSFSDLKDAGELSEQLTTVAYCYDNADRLLSTSGTGAVAGASPITDGLASTDVAYDAHGNTITLADQSITYDVADNHLTTTVDGQTVTYTRDVTGSIVARQSTSDPFAAIRYTAGAVMDGSNTTLQRTLSLPGGVSVSLEADASQKWNYPNLHGDNIVQADGAGLRIGTRAAYDPFGQPIDPVTGDIGTTIADDAVADTTPGDADHAWVGGHRKLYEHQGSIATIEMGARQYVAALGRFLEVDPIEGGVSNDYDYPADPINMVDLNGQWAIAIPFALGAIVLEALVVAAVGTAAIILVSEAVRLAEYYAPKIQVATMAAVGLAAATAVSFSANVTRTAVATASAVARGPMLQTPKAPNWTASSRTAVSASAAFAAAMHCQKHTRGIFRPLCGSKDRFHVDFLNSKGEVVHTIHFRWRR